MYQTCHCVVTCNRGLNNGLNTESSKVSIKGILGVLLWDDQDQWSEWSQITDSDPDHCKGTHPLTLSWMILLFCEDPVVGSLTSLECALDGFHKLSHMAEEVFGEDVFSSRRKKGKQNINVSGKRRPFSIIMLACNYPMSPLRTCHWIVCLACYFFVPAVTLSSFNNSYFPFPKRCIIVLIVSITKCFNLIGT